MGTSNDERHSGHVDVGMADPDCTLCNPFAAPTPEQPTAPRCQTWGYFSGEQCSLPEGHLGKHDLPPGPFRFTPGSYSAMHRSEAAASVPVPEQDEAVRTHGQGALVSDELWRLAEAGDLEAFAQVVAWTEARPFNGHTPDASMQLQGLSKLAQTALATPPPVPAAPGRCQLCGGPHLSAEVHPYEELRAWEQERESRKRQAEKVAACPAHDTNGPVDEPSGFPTCSKCGAILTETVPAAPPLDVERLTQVLWNSVDESRAWLDGEATSHNFASWLAAEYARLTQQEDGE